MGITRSVSHDRTTQLRGRSLDRPRALLFALLLLLPTVAGCTSVRPVVKIGLIAPFEGLYRASGYAALDGLRRGLADCAPSGVDVLPLALDDSADPDLARRAAQKLLVDPAVIAVIGPFPLAAVEPVAAVMATTDLPWIVPGLVDPTGGFADPTATAWVTAMVETVIAADAPGRVLLTGLPPQLAADLSSTVAQTPLLRVADADALTATLLPGDAVVWLAAPDAGAAWHTAHPDVPIWLGAPYGGRIWAQRTDAPRATSWLFWTDREYNAWSQQPSAPAEPSAYQTYRAACAVLAKANAPTPAAPWQLTTRELSTAP